jgi:peptidoglycan/LPS O-acetylase OafA/YrhL
MFFKIFTSSEQQNLTRFDVLDGFRGLLAISVVLQHTVAVFWMGKMDPNFNLLDHVGTYFGIPSFFILSSFLLTFKLLETMNKSNGSFDEIQTIVLKYLIRRFFRIYVPYFIFCSYMSTGLSFANQRGFSYDSWYNMISLTKTGRNHLWTCIPEMKYYLFIPLLTFFVYKTQKMIVIWISLYIIISVYIEQYNWLDLHCVHIPWPHGISLKYSLRIFLNGSILGLIFYKYNQFTNHGFSFIRKFGFIVTIIIIIAFIYGLMLTTSSYMGHSIVGFCHYKYSVYWSCFIILLLLHQKSLFSVLINLSIFKKFGQFSFGVYLLHYEMLNVVYWFENTVVLKYPIMIIILELIVSFTAGMIFFYLIENPMMNIGNLIIKCLPEQSNGNIFQKNSIYLTKHLISIIKFLFIFLFYFFSLNYFNF